MSDEREKPPYFESLNAKWGNKAGKTFIVPSYLKGLDAKLDLSKKGQTFIIPTKKKQ